MSETPVLTLEAVQLRSEGQSQVKPEQPRQDNPDRTVASQMACLCSQSEAGSGSVTGRCCASVKCGGLRSDACLACGRLCLSVCSPPLLLFFHLSLFFVRLPPRPPNHHHHLAPPPVAPHSGLEGRHGGPQCPLWNHRGPVLSGTKIRLTPSSPSRFFSPAPRTPPHPPTPIVPSIRLTP